MSGCREVGTADDVRTGADTVLDEFLTQVTRQRKLSGSTDLTWTPAALCRTIDATPRPVVPTTADAMTNVTLCRYSAKGKADSMIRLGADQAHAIVTDVATHSAKSQRLPCPTPPPGTESHGWRLALSNSYGDAILLESSCAGRFFYSTAGNSERQWIPSERIIKLLDRIAAR